MLIHNISSLRGRASRDGLYIRHRRDGTHFGCFFFVNASTPILKLSPATSLLTYSCLVREVACSTLGLSQASRNPCLVTIIPSGEKLVIRTAISMHSSTTDLGDLEIRFINRYSKASWAESLRPVIASSEASCRPTIRMSRGRPPAAAYSPTATSGNPNCASGDATIMSLSRIPLTPLL